MKSLTKLWWGCCSGLLMVMLLVAIQPVALAAVTITPADGNPTCSTLVPGTFAFELKVEPVADGVYSLNGVDITVDVRSTPAGQVFDWSSSGGVVNAVFVKGGPNGLLYEYDPAATSDTGLHAQVNLSNGRYYGLSHISFCVTPGEASIDVTKACAEQSVNGDVVTTRNTVTLKNDGDFELTGIQVREETDGLTCKLTKVGGVALGAPVALTLNTYVAVPNGGSFDGNLAVNESVVLEVSCANGALNLANTISGKGTASNSDVVDDTSTNNPAAQCPFSPKPLVSIDKDCAADSDVRLMAMNDMLVAEVCPTIIVTNESSTEPLSTVTVTDSQIPALAGGVNVGPLAPGAWVNLGDSYDLCYLPSAPEVAAFDDNETTDPSDDKYLPSHSGFFNKATVVAAGKFGGTAQDSDDTAIYEADGITFKYLLDKDGKQVLDSAGHPIPLSECPLCTPCPDCNAPL